MVDIQYQVIDPIGPVTHRILTAKDLVEVLGPTVRRVLRQTCRKYASVPAFRAEVAANEQVEGMIFGEEFGFHAKVQVHLDAAPEAVELEREAQLESLRRQTRILREEARQDLLTQRMAFYRQAIESNDANQFALWLAENPQDVSQVIRALRDDRDLSRQMAVDLLKSLAETGLIERYDLNESARSTLSSFLETPHYAALSLPRLPGSPVSGSEEPRAIGPAPDSVGIISQVSGGPHPISSSISQSTYRRRRLTSKSRLPSRVCWRKQALASQTKRNP